MKRCFTLIELMVVVGIIAILAAILLPALNQARSKARTAACLSSKKQVTQVFLFYSNDFADQMPIHKLADDSKTQAWSHPSRELYTLNYLKSPNPAKNVADKLLACPDATNLAIVVKNDTEAAVATRGTVGYNGYLVNDSDFNKSLKLTTLKFPSVCIMLGENYNGQNFLYYNTYSLPHQNGFVGAFFDGHIKLLNRSEIPSLPAERNLPFWCGK